MATQSEWIDRADRAAAAGDRRGARVALEAAVAMPGADARTWLKLAAMCRQMSEPDAAMAAVTGALRLDPLDFMALLMRASLLDQRGDGEAGEAYGRALAQRPAGDLPPAVARAVERAQVRHADHVAALSDALAQATRDVEARASAEERARIARLRSNTTRATRPYHSEPTHYHFPGLVEREFHDRADHPWLAELEAETDAIEAEFRAVAGAERAELVPYIQYPDDAPTQQWKPLNHSRDWTAIHLVQNGRPIAANARHCPTTMALLKRLPQPEIAGCCPNAMFSLLAPGTHIPPHVGIANARLVCHLPLVVPPGCWFRVGAETRPWMRGSAFVFDDTIEHEAMNPSDALRVVLIVDVWHPGLSPVEQEAVRAVLEHQGGFGSGL
jgi:aspartyl/asparaginyl beta-hydroxylase (cupin superfamily)